MTEPYRRNPDPLDQDALAPAQPINEASLTAGWSASDVDTADLVDDDWIAEHTEVISDGLGR